MASEAETTANSIIAQALQNAGVPPRNIELPPVTEQSEPQGRPNLDGSLKGQVKGELEVEEPEVPETEEAPEISEPEIGEAEKQQLAKADIEVLIDQASAKFQSIMDRKINQLQAQMQQTVGALNQFFMAQEESSLANLPQEEQVLKRLERLERGKLQPQVQPQLPVEQQPVQFYQQLVHFVDAVGLKVDDKRIDWAPEVSDPQTGFNRFIGSLKKALVEDQTNTIKELKNNGDKEIQKIRKRTGIDKVSTTGPSGAGLPNFDKMTPLQKLEYAFQQQAQEAGKS